MKYTHVKCLEDWFKSRLTGKIIGDTYSYYIKDFKCEFCQEKIPIAVEFFGRTIGFDVLRQQRFDRMKELGIVDESMDLPMFEVEFNGKRPTWESLTEKQQEAWINDMATYAAMIEIMDDGIGEMIEALKKKGMYENTIFMFLSDNGSTSESGYIKQIMADLSNTPYRSYKKWVFQGGKIGRAHV